MSGDRRPSRGVRRRLAPSSDRSGIAAVEFAILGPILGLAAILVLDSAYAFNSKLKLTNGVTAAAQYAFQTGRSLAAADVAAFNARVGAVVATTAELDPAPRVTVRFNDVADASRAAEYFCVAGSPPVWASTGTKAATCGGGAPSGQFVTIEASATTATLFPGNPVLGAVVELADRAVVRVR